MVQHSKIAYTGNPLDRAGNARRDPAFLAEALEHPEAKFLPVFEGAPLIEKSGFAPGLGWLPMSYTGFGPEGVAPIFLGLDGAAPRWALRAHNPVFEEFGQHVPLRETAKFLLREELAIAGQAAWLTQWQSTQGYCSRTGAPTRLGEGGLKHINDDHGHEYFPRIEPVAIVLPIFEDRVCLATGTRFPEGLVSALAGFVEPGESLEECAAREVAEEVGLKVTHTQYVVSQPWPFPASLMVGFLAEVTGDELTLDPQEISDARFYTRDEVSALTDGQRVAGKWAPPPEAVAHQLVKAWLSR